MNSKTLNPILMLGSYLGLLAGILLSFKGWYFFQWLPALLGIQADSQILVNAVGGFFTGYILQILFRVFENKPNKK
jgi:hypothetical protein